MDKLKIDVLLDEGVKMPNKAYDTDAGFDLYTPFSFTLRARGSARVDTGVHMIIPEGWCGVLVSKSGLNTKSDIESTGLVDSLYTGSIVVKLQSHLDRDYRFEKGDKISQLTILPVPKVTLRKVKELPLTERGSNGFGSSGR